MDIGELGLSHVILHRETSRCVERASQLSLVKKLVNHAGSTGTTGVRSWLKAALRSA